MLHVLTHSFLHDALPIYDEQHRRGRGLDPDRARRARRGGGGVRGSRASDLRTISRDARARRDDRRIAPPGDADARRDEAPPPRSEEHTSELQSLMRISYAVFCLKKKKLHQKRRTENTTQTI